jgi:hypothetical protein
MDLDNSRFNKNLSSDNNFNRFVNNYKEYISLSDNSLAGLFIGKNGINIKNLKKNHPNVSVSVKENYKTKAKYVFAISESQVALNDCVIDINNLINKIEKINNFHKKENNIKENKKNLDKDKMKLNIQNEQNRNIINKFEGLEIESDSESESE